MSIMEDIRALERAAWRMGELWERYQGKGWPDKEGDIFCGLRDEKTPALREAILTKHADQLAAVQEARDSFEGSFLAADSALTKREAQLSKAIELLAECEANLDDIQDEGLCSRVLAFLREAGHE